MLFLSVDDFYQKAEKIVRLSREEEKACAMKMAAGDEAARAQIICQYLPMIAVRIKHAPQRIRTLHTVYCCLQALEQAVDGFDFMQERESFAHYFSRALRQCVTKCIAFS